MATVTFNKFNDYSEQKNRGVHNWGAHVFKWALTNTAPTAANTVLADITQIAAGNGYTTGGTTTTAAISETGGTTTVTLTEVVFTASGGSMGTFRYAVLYNDTATSPADALVGWIDYGAAITLGAGETFTIRANNASPGTLFTDV
jgi:hypothetical protein